MKNELKDKIIEKAGLNKDKKYTDKQLEDVKDFLKVK